jgi:hypothetical protein
MSEVPEKCPSCGGGTTANMLTCEWCGHAVVSFDTLADELKAIQELTRSAQKIASKSGGFGGMLGAMTDSMSAMAEGKGPPGGLGSDPLGKFWASAYIPRTFEAQLQLFTQASGQIETSGNMNRSMNASVASKNKSLYAFAERVAARMEQDHGSDAQARPKIQAVKNQLADMKKGMRSGSLKFVAYFVVMMLAMGGFMFYQFSAATSMIEESDEKAAVQEAAQDLDDTKAKCRGKSDGCQDACRIEACTDLCTTHKLQWACDSLEMLQ